LGLVKLATFFSLVDFVVVLVAGFILGDDARFCLELAEERGEVLNFRIVWVRLRLLEREAVLLRSVSFRRVGAGSRTPTSLQYP
jgi:hypothetical protein